MINVGPAKILGKRVRRPLDGKSTRAGAARRKEGEAEAAHSINPFVKYFPMRRARRAHPSRPRWSGAAKVDPGRPGNEVIGNSLRYELARGRKSPR